MATPRGSALLFVALLLASPGIAAAQSGTIRGRVTEAGSNTPVGNARISVQQGVRTVAQAISSASGNYRVSVDPGTYTVVVRLIGYTEGGRQAVTVAAGGTAEVNVTLAEAPSLLNQVVVTETRGTSPQKVLDAPAQVSVIDERQLAERPALTVADHLKGQPGVDVSTGGIVQSNIVSRGFNNAFSGAMLVLQDNRFASVPSLRVNVPALFPVVNEDIERIEILLGPAAALYGPNSASGVMHLITKSPFTSQGTTFNLDGGQRGIFRFSGRNAYAFNSKAAMKVSGEYMQGNDWIYIDPAEPDSLSRPTGVPGARARVDNARDYHVRKGGGEFRLDLRPSANTEWINTYGLSKLGTGIEITGANGAAQIRNWQYQSVQSRFRHNRTFAQFFANFSDAGNKDSVDTRGTFLLRTGTPIVDLSRVYSAQLQQAFDMGASQTFIAGADYIFTNPRTGNTINGRNEDIDNVTEYGGYLHSVSRLSPLFELTAAVRLDKHSQMEETFFSPRAALVFKPGVNQNFRVTFNRAFSTPANFSFFLDLPSGITPFAPVRALGVPMQGMQFDRTSTGALGGVGGLYMRTSNLWPTAVGGPNQRMAANAIPGHGIAFGALVAGGLRARLIASGLSPAQADGVIATLSSSTATQMTAANVGTVLRLFDPARARATPPVPFPTVVNPTTGVRDLERLKASFNNVIELGYKGGLAQDRVLLSLSAWREQRENFVTASQNISPNVFLDPTTLGAFYAARLQAAGFPAPTAAAIGATVAASAATVPLGTVVPEAPNGLTSRNDIIFSYRNVAEKITLYGGDLALDIQATDRVGFTGNYSYVDRGSFPNISSGVDILRLNAPRSKGAFAMRYRDDRRGLGTELRYRYTQSFRVNSGVYVGEVPENSMIDVMASYRLPAVGGSATLSLYGTNLLDQQHPTFVGVPAIGRMVMGRVAYTF